jgi:hypothetical protein
MGKISAESRKRMADLDFLEKLKTAPLSELHVMATNHQQKDTPPWKKVAIARAINRASKGTS